MAAEVFQPADAVRIRQHHELQRRLDGEVAREVVAEEVVEERAEDGIVDVGDLDVGVSDEIAFVDEIQFVDEMPDPVPEPAAPQAAAADTSSVNELYSR